MKPVDFFARLGAGPLPHRQCGKGMQRRMVEKDAVSYWGLGDTNYYRSWMRQFYRAQLRDQVVQRRS